MDLFLCVIIFFQISIALVFFAKWAEKNICVYDTMFCQDVHASLGMCFPTTLLLRIQGKD